MKQHFIKTIVLIVLSVATLASCQNNQAKFIIKGEISGLADSTKVLLIPGMTHKNEDPVSEVYAKSGKFSFIGVLNEPRFFQIQIETKTTSYIPVFFENGEMTLSACLDSSKQKIDVSTVDFKGSDIYSLYKEKMAFKDLFNEKYVAKQKKYKSLSEFLSNAYEVKNQSTIDSIMGTEEYMMSQEDDKKFFENIESVTNKAIMDNKDTWWGPFIMMSSMSYFTEAQQPLYNSFSQEAKDSYYGKLVYKELWPEKLIGKRVPIFELSDKLGKNYSSIQLQEGKKYVLIDFWASWCAPCRKEIPNLKKIYEEFSDKGLQIISISIDKKKKAWEKALVQENMLWVNLWDSKNVSDSFMVKAIPALFLVDEKGVVIADNLRGEALYAKMEELFSK